MEDRLRALFTDPSINQLLVAVFGVVLVYVLAKILQRSLGLTFQ